MFVFNCIFLSIFSVPLIPVQIEIICLLSAVTAMVFWHRYNLQKTRRRREATLQHLCFFHINCGSASLNNGSEALVYFSLNICRSVSRKHTTPASLTYFSFFLECLSLFVCSRDLGSRRCDTGPLKHGQSNDQTRRWPSSGSFFNLGFIVSAILWYSRWNLPSIFLLNAN